MKGELSSDEPSGGRKTVSIQIGVFLVLILFPLLFFGAELVSRDRFEMEGQNLREKLRYIEDEFSKLATFERMRDSDQSMLTRFLSAGNSRVVVGGKDWLHYRSDIDAVIGKGPYYAEPPSVARAPGQRPWKNAREVIPEFAEQLRDRGIHLTLVPVPTKSMLVSLDGQSRALIPSYYSKLVAEMEGAGVEVFDLVTHLNDSGSFLRQDTHWTPSAMKRVSRVIANRLGRTESSPLIENSLELGMTGDLVGMLVRNRSLARFSLMPVELFQVVDPATMDPVESDSDSPWVLLGDSFVNVFDDPMLGFDGANSGVENERLGAGLAEHLMQDLGRPLHVIAMNGSGATGVRRSFASLPDDIVRSKERLIWVVSARDLLLAESPGRRAGVEWDRVEFSERQGKNATIDGELVITATLQKKSLFGDPSTTPYSEAVYSAVFGEIKVEEGNYDQAAARVFFWAFRNREIEATGRIKVGQRYRLTISPFPMSGPVSKAKQLDDFFLPDLPLFFADSFEEIK